MPITRRIITIIVAVFAIGLLSGCDTQEKSEWRKIDQPVEPAVQEAEIREKAQIKEIPEVELPQEKTSPVTPGKETKPAKMVSDEKNAVSALYISAKKCKKCHLKQYKSWKKTKMAASFENLKPGVNADAKKKAGLDPDKDYTADPDCLKCHTTGYGRPGGFVSLEKTPDLINVQCETCHGPGSKYSRIMKKNKKFKRKEVIAVGFVVPLKATAEKECLVCHGGENPFNEKVDPKYKFDLEDRFKNTHIHRPLKYKH